MMLVEKILKGFLYYDFSENSDIEMLVKAIRKKLEKIKNKTKRRINCKGVERLFLYHYL